jgi:hypothetical protein
MLIVVTSGGFRLTKALTVHKLEYGPKLLR